MNQKKLKILQNIIILNFKKIDKNFFSFILIDEEWIQNIEEILSNQ